jgi:hypothetical protein
MWTPETRAEQDRDDSRYPSDLTAVDFSRHNLRDDQERPHSPCTLNCGFGAESNFPRAVVTVQA